jgi:hypothetical protein
MCGRRVEVLRADLGPAEPRRDAGLLRNLFVGQAVEKLSRAASRALRVLGIPEALLCKRERAPGSDFDHARRTSGQRSACPFADRLPIRVEVVRECHDALEIGHVGRVPIGRRGQLVAEQCPSLLVAANQLVQHRRHDRYPQPQRARILGRQTQERA